MPKSILYLVPDLFGLPGGIARYCQTVCRALSEAGAFFSVIALMDQIDGTGVAEPLLGTMPYEACAGSRVAFVLRAVRQTLRQHPVLIIVGHPYFAPLGWVLARLTGARTAAFLYGVDVWEPLSLFRRQALRRMDGLIAISNYTAQRAIASNQLAVDKIRILYNCLDPQFEQTEVRQARPRRSLLTVARISKSERYKGHDYIIRALPQILAQYPDLVYDIIGDGAGRLPLETLVQQLGVVHAVRLHGRVSDERLRQFYAEASIFIMPSTHEGFGFVFAEAMAYGVPAIGGNVDATPEVIVDGETGYCVNPTSTVEIAQAVLRLLDDEALRQRLGQQAACHVREKFGFARFQQQLLACLQKVAPQIKGLTVDKPSKD